MGKRTADSVKKLDQVIVKTSKICETYDGEVKKYNGFLTELRACKYHLQTLEEERMKEVNGALKLVAAAQLNLGQLLVAQAKETVNTLVSHSAASDILELVDAEMQGTGDTEANMRYNVSMPLKYVTSEHVIPPHESEASSTQQKENS